MNANYFSLLLAFLEGFALIISPCILPILPLILTGALTGSKFRPYGIILGFVLAFTVVTLFSRAIVGYAHIPPTLLRNISFVILLLLGIVIFSDYLSEKFTQFTKKLTQVGTLSQKGKNDFLGGILFGCLIGVVWTPCAGPILAAVVVQSVIQKTTLHSFLIVIFFAIGVTVPMFLIVLMGRNFITKFSFLRTRATLFRKIVGILIILSVIVLIYSPNLALVRMKVNPNLPSTMLLNGLEHPYPAPSIEGIDAWINSPPLKISDLKGKVVLIDFWAYSCINCIRTLPYLKDWYQKYHDKGFVIIGVHSPEFQFEHDINNVKKAVKQYGILYPVALDNRFVTWQNYNNAYWPAHYLINKDGNVVYQHFGEGNEAITENNIRFLLGIRTRVSPSTSETAEVLTETPETYLGYDRAKYFASPETPGIRAIAVYSYPQSLELNEWALKGKWIIDLQKVVSGGEGASIKIRFKSKNVYAVMGIKQKPVKIKVFLNGAPISDKKGEDVTNGEVTIDSHRLYRLVSQKQVDEGILELRAEGQGLEIYTFTFGK